MHNINDLNTRFRSSHAFPRLNGNAANKAHNLEDPGDDRVNENAVRPMRRDRVVACSPSATP